MSTLDVPPIRPSGAATPTRPPAGALASSSGRERRGPRWPLLAFALLAIGAAVGFIAYPTYPNYDSYYALLWGRELLDGGLPVYETYRAPTPHPLTNAVGALLAPLGHGAERLWIALCVTSFLALAAGVYRLAREVFTPLIGLVAALLLVTRFDFPFYAARGYLDIAFTACVVWAGVLEARRPRRGTPVLVLLAAAGLLRPEAWLMAGLYWLWLFPRASWAARARTAALAAVGPLVWTLTDLLVTGRPLYSLTYTSGFAEELGRSKSGGELVPAIWEALLKLDKAPVLVGGIVGLVVAAVLVPRRLAVPLALLGVGIATFLLVGLGGFSVIDRYLLVASLMVMVLCAVTLAGWTLLEPGGRLRRAWAIGAGVLVLGGIVFSATRIDLGRLEEELVFRADAHAALHDLLAAPAVRAGLRCGPVSVPSHKLVPDVRWILDRGERGVVARSERTPRRGVAVYVHGRSAVLRQALVQETDDPRIQVPPPGFRRIAVSRYYSAYVRCR